MSPLPISTTAAFAALTLALAALWVPGVLTARRAEHLWTLPCALALVIALLDGLIEITGLLALLSFAVVCAVARRSPGPILSVVAHATLFVMCAGLFLHVIPGFHNPRLVTEAVLGPGSEPYTKYLNFDKGCAALFLLGIYAPDRARHDEGMRRVGTWLWQFAIIATVVMTLTVVVGYVRWDPKLPPWWAAWTWSMIFLVALPEEVLFRGIVQTSIGNWMSNTRRATTIAIVASGALFGIAHIGGGPTYVLLAAVAGIGYGWIYASTRSIAGAIAAHAGLNTIHFLLFSYPALRAASTTL